ncbi:MAG: hypothetical protein ABIJ96_01880 [Elusimicrobiota bacterium]
MKLRAGLLAGALSLLAAAGPASSRAQECFDCHGEAGFQTERDGKPLSLHVDQKKFAASVHQGLACVSCHADLEGKEIPHAERLRPVDCGVCHAEPQKKFADSLHGKALARGDKLAPRCASCHGKHDILPAKHPQSAVAPLRVPYICGSCHQEGAAVQSQREIHQHNILQNYSQSIHGEGLMQKGLSVSATCASCHSAHQILPHTDPRSTIAHGNVVRTCTQCHGQIENVHRKIIKGELWQKAPGVIPVCVECHQPHKARKVFYDQGTADKDCLSCHARKNIRSADGRSLFVDQSHLAGSAHAGNACAQCHKGVTPSKQRPCEKVAKKVDCAVCHNDQVERYQKSIHGTLQAQGDQNAPSCAECHGTHGIGRKADPNSAIFPLNVPKLCGSCHREGEKAAVRRHSKERDILTHYAESIHGKGLLKSGLVVTATCSNCHTAHGELPADRPESSVNQKNIAQTCAKCHHGVYEQFTASVHSPLKTATSKELPVCSSCHSAHTIGRTDRDQFKLEITDQCGKCHKDETKSYFETYHGKVSQLGYAKTAKCHDCHGAHNILGINEPDSTLSHQNITDTCRKCHPGATKKFAGYLTHSTHHDPHKYPLIFWTFWAMTALLIGTFLAFGLHTLLWLPRSLQMRREHPPEPYDEKKKQLRRFSPLQQVQHVVMIVSFLTLTLTGMTLKFSYAGWAVVLAKFLGGFEAAGILHRFAAVTMILLFASHLWDLARKVRSHKGSYTSFLLGPNSMLPAWKDLGEVIATLKWYLGLGPRPRYGRWTYWEKFDYFAVFWGVTIIGSTGLALWFPEVVTILLPGWIINVATIIHSDEALLASGFIFTIHFFNTHFRPEKFPMDIVVFTGRMPLAEFQRERPEEYEELVREGRLDERLANPLPLWAIRAIRAGAWTALAIGTVSVLAIIYAMLFAYR